MKDQKECPEGTFPSEEAIEIRVGRATDTDQVLIMLGYPNDDLDEPVKRVSYRCATPDQARRIAEALVDIAVEVEARR